MDWMQILVIILSAFLALFLLLSIILVVLLIRVTRQIKSVTGAAERTAHKVEDVAANLSAASSPAVLMKVVSAFITSFKK